MFASFACFAAAIGTLFAALLLIGWSWRHTLLAPDSLDAAPHLAVILVAAMMPLRAIIQSATHMFSAGGRGMAIALQTAIQASVGFIVTVFALFVLHLAVTALFLGAFVGLFANMAASLFVLRRSYGALAPSRSWLARVKATAPTSGAMGLIDGVRGVLENAFLARGSGLASVGYFGHARLYQNLLMILANSVGHNVWAVALAEARNLKANFEMLARVWGPLQLMQVTFGLTFALVGPEIVELISHGKLTPAAVFVAPLVATLLIQSSAQAALAVTMGNGLGIFAIRFRIASMTLGTIALWPAIHHFGIAGLIGVLTAEALAYRLCLVVLARRVRRIPFQDGIVVGGVLAIALVTGGVALFEPSFTTRLVLLAVVLLAGALAYRRSLADLVMTGRGLIFGTTP